MLFLGINFKTKNPFGKTETFMWKLLPHDYEDAYGDDIMKENLDYWQQYK